MSWRGSLCVKAIQVETIKLLGLRHRARTASTSDADRAMVQLKQTSDHSVQGDHESTLWTASWCENGFHTSINHNELGLKWPKVQKKYASVQTTLGCFHIYIP